MLPIVVAIGPWLWFAAPLAVLIPFVMILLTRAIAGRFGNDSFRLRR